MNLKVESVIESEGTTDKKGFKNGGKPVLESKSNFMNEPKIHEFSDDSRIITVIEILNSPDKILDIMMILQGFL